MSGNLCGLVVVVVVGWNLSLESSWVGSRVVVVTVVLGEGLV